MKIRYIRPDAGDIQRTYIPDSYGRLGKITCITSNGPVSQSQMKSLLTLLTLAGALLLPQTSATHGHKIAFFAPDRPKATAFFAPDRPKTIAFFAPDRPKTFAFFAPDRPKGSRAA
jgi:hypothetical protein